MSEVRETQKRVRSLKRIQKRIQKTQKRVRSLKRIQKRIQKAQERARKQEARRVLQDRNFKTRRR